jgi:hypothetical protein
MCRPRFVKVTQITIMKKKTSLLFHCVGALLVATCAVWPWLAAAGTLINSGSFFVSTPPCGIGGTNSWLNGGTNEYYVPIGAGSGAATVTNVPSSNTVAVSISGASSLAISFDLSPTNLPLAGYGAAYFGASIEDLLYTTASNGLVIVFPVASVGATTNRVVFSTNVPASAIGGWSSLRLLGIVNSNMSGLYLSNLNYRVVQTTY